MQILHRAVYKTSAEVQLYHCLFTAHLWQAKVTFILN